MVGHVSSLIDLDASAREHRALLRRRGVRNVGDFLADVLDRLLANGHADTPTDGRLQLSLVDGSTVSLPGSTGSDWRLHARYEPARGRFTDLAITEATTDEALCCVAVRAFPGASSTPAIIAGLSIRSIAISQPPSSTTAIADGHPFRDASASAAAMTRLACSHVMIRLTTPYESAGAEAIVVAATTASRAPMNGFID